MDRDGSGLHRIKERAELTGIKTTKSEEETIK